MAEDSDKLNVSLVSVLLVRLRFIMLFVVVGVLVAKWDWIASRVERLTRPAKASEGVEGAFEFYCPMHPSVVRGEPGNCPICGMPLSKRKKGEREELPEGVLSRLQLSPFRIRQAGVGTVEVKFRSLVREIRAVGFIEYDERRIARLSARIAGRADELFINFTGVKVEKGDKVYSLYSPDLVSTEQEYLIARETLKDVEARAKPDEAAVVRARRLVAATYDRLRLWGISDTQIKEIEDGGRPQDHLTIYSPIAGIVVEKEIREGQYVQEGEAPYTIADDSLVWMQAEVFERDIGALAIDQEVAVTTETWPGEVFIGKVAFIYPRLSPETRTVKVRVDVPNPDRRLRPGMYATAVLRIPAGKHGEVFYTCCEGCGGHGDEPGQCPKCSKAMVKAGGVTGAHEEGAETAERRVWVCTIHPETVWDAPGKCEKCGGMELEEQVIPKGKKLVFTCPDHPSVQLDAPGTCPEPLCGKQLHFQVVGASGKVVEKWVCPLDPIRQADGKLKCPECGCEMKHLEYEEVLAAPLTAVIDTGEKKVVYIDRGNGVFEAVEVMIGPRAGEYYPVLSGLHEGDRVVTAGAFLLDAETRLNPSAAAAYFGASGQEKGK